MTEIIYGIDRNRAICCADERTLKEITDLIMSGKWQYPTEFFLPRVRTWHGCLLVDDVRGPGSFYEDFGPDRTLIMQYIMEGKTLSDMSKLMHLSEKGVRYHIETMKRALHVSTREELVAKYFGY